MKTHTPSIHLRTDNTHTASQQPPPPPSDVAEAMKHNWPLIKTVFKEQYMALTDDDLVYCEGNEDELFERLEHKIGRPREEFEQLVFLSEIS